MKTNSLGALLGTIQYDAAPSWSRLALAVLRFLHLPLWRQRQAQWALSSIRVYQQGIELLSHGSRPSRSFAYTSIRRVWFETFTSGNEASGHLSARIDVIADNLDVLFTLTLHDRPASHPDVELLRQLHDLWRKATWKHYHVVAAIVEHQGKYLCMQKGATRYAYTSYHWEFPGGKVEPGEQEPEALRRELQEEMDYEVSPVRHLTTVEHTYPDFSLSLSCWLCSAETTEFVRKEHADHRWLTPAEMQQLEWCAADQPAVNLLAPHSAQS